MILKSSDDFEKLKEMLEVDNAGKKCFFENEPVNFPCLVKWVESESDGVSFTLEGDENDEEDPFDDSAEDDSEELEEFSTDDYYVDDELMEKADSIAQALMSGEEVPDGVNVTSRGAVFFSFIFLEKDELVELLEQDKG